MPVTKQARPSRLVAEALVEGHDRSVFVERARSMGLPRGLTDVLLAACPCESHKVSDIEVPTASARRDSRSSR
jgi:hypothetical protein